MRNASCPITFLHKVGVGDRLGYKDLLLLRPWHFAHTCLLIFGDQLLHKHLLSLRPWHVAHTCLQLFGNAL